MASRAWCYALHEPGGSSSVKMLEFQTKVPAHAATLVLKKGYISILKKKIYIYIYIHKLQRVYSYIDKYLICCTNVVMTDKFSRIVGFFPTTTGNPPSQRSITLISISLGPFLGAFNFLLHTSTKCYQL